MTHPSSYLYSPFFSVFTVICTIITFFIVFIWYSTVNKIPFLFLCVVNHKFFGQSNAFLFPLQTTIIFIFYFHFLLIPFDSNTKTMAKDPNMCNAIHMSVGFFLLFLGTPFFFSTADFPLGFNTAQNFSTSILGMTQNDL